MKQVFKDETVTIEFNAKEAAVLRVVCNTVGGHPSGPRGVIDALSTILELNGYNLDAEGVTHPLVAEAMDKLNRDYGEGIYFQ